MKLSVTGTALCAVTSLGIMATPAASAATTQVATTAATTAATTQVATTARQAVLVRLTQQQRAAKAIRFAYMQIGDWYRYGGSGPSTWDCSGLAGGAWRYAGVKLPRVTTSIYRSVHKKVAWKSLQPGDLVFFYGLGHVGIYVGKGYMIHAPHTGQRVKKVKLSSYQRQNFAGAVRPGA